MYQSCHYLATGWNVIDDDFIATAGNSVSIWAFIVATYEERKLPVVPNLIRAIVRWNAVGISTPELVEHIIRNEDIDKYKPELEKYLLLI